MKLVHTREGSTCIQALWWEKVLDLLAATWEATWLNAFKCIICRFVLLPILSVFGLDTSVDFGDVLCLLCLWSPRVRWSLRKSFFFITREVSMR